MYVLPYILSVDSLVDMEVFRVPHLGQMTGDELRRSENFTYPYRQATVFSVLY